MEHKLLPAMQRWQQELGASFPFEFERFPILLTPEKTPEKVLIMIQYLASIGIRSPERLGKKFPNAVSLALGVMQHKVAFLRACLNRRASHVFVGDSSRYFASHDRAY